MIRKCSMAVTMMKAVPIIIDSYWKQIASVGHRHSVYFGVHEGIPRNDGDSCAPSLRDR